MKRSVKITLVAAFAMFVSVFANAQKVSYVGRTETDVMNKHELVENLTLIASGEGQTKSVSLEGYSILNFKGVSITGEVTVDAKGNIVATDKIVVKGAPGKVKTVSGVMDGKKADIILDGKAAGMFSFHVHYVAEVK